MVGRQVAGGDRGPRVESREDPLDRGEQHVRDDDVCARQLVQLAVEERRLDATLLTAAFAIVVSTATGSLSTARIGSNPSREAAIESTPEPQPTSSSEPRSDRASSSMHRRVVGWAPVPNARPGSITTAGSPGPGCSHGGPIQSPPARAGPVERPPGILPARFDGSDHASAKAARIAPTALSST